MTRVVPLFCAPRRKLIVELDGSQHLEQQDYDAERTEFLKSEGYKVLRFWNNDVMNDIDSVINVICDTLNEKIGTEPLDYYQVSCLWQEQ